MPAVLGAAFGVTLRGSITIASTGCTAGAGTASTVNGPVTRTFDLSTNGWS